MLRRDHPTSRFRRRLITRWLAPEERYEVSGSVNSALRVALDEVASIRFWQLSGQYLAAVCDDWVEPARIEKLIRGVVAVAAAIDSSDQPRSSSPR